MSSRSMLRWPGALGLVLAVSGLTTGCDLAVGTDEEAGKGKGKHRYQEEFLYVVAINRGVPDPDSIYVVGADPRKRHQFGDIINRIDMPNVGDEVHHFNYSLDQERLLVPGLFSGRMHVFDIKRRPHQLRLISVDENLTADSGYIVPHTVIGLPGHVALVTMIGAATETTGPGGVVLISDKTGKFISHVGPGPDRTEADLGPKYMYDLHFNTAVNRAVSTTFGWPAGLAGGINPAGLGDEVAVWDINNQKVIQTVNLGANSGALESRWIEKPGSTYGYTNTPGTSAIWLWEDEDGDGFYDFHQVLGPEDGLLLPVDILMDKKFKYMYVTNWFGNTVQQFDIRNRYEPVLVGEATVPHANMLRLSVDGKRLYVSNSLLSTWDDDDSFGPPRNTDYGIWLFEVNTKKGGLKSVTADGSAWVDFDNVEKASSVGPAGPHMMLFDPTIMVELGYH